MLEIFELVQSATTSLLNLSETALNAVNVYFLVAKKVDKPEDTKARKHSKKKKHSK